MKPRTSPLESPTRWPYVRTSDEICDVIRVPSAGEIQDALEEANKLPEGASRAESQLGATIACGWASSTHELESKDGRAVYRELHDAGWRMSRIAELASLITDEFKASVSESLPAEVKEAEGFTDATP